MADEEATYIDVDDVREAGLTDEEKYTDDAVNAAIARQTSIVDRICRQWFVPVEMTVLLDGTGTDTLLLDFPIITVTGLYVNNQFGSPLPEAHYRVYNGRGRGSDDRTCPMIKLVSDCGVFGGSRRFARGSQNQKVVGTFGYVEADGSTPGAIKRAMLKLVIRDLNSLPLAGAGSGGSGGGAPIGPKISETTDGHSISFAAPAITGLRMGTMAITGDPEVDKYLELYIAPRAMAVT